MKTMTSVDGVLTVCRPLHQHAFGRHSRCRRRMPLGLPCDPALALVSASTCRAPRGPGTVTCRFQHQVKKQKLREVRSLSRCMGRASGTHAVGPQGLLTPGRLWEHMQ